MLGATNIPSSLSTERAVVLPGRATAMARRLFAPDTPAALATLAVAVGLLAAAPVVYLLVRAASAGPATWDVVARPSTGWLFMRSAGLAAAVTSTTIAIGVPLAWLTTRTDLPGRRLWSTLFVVPLAFPSYVFALALTGAFGDRGMVSAVLGFVGASSLPRITGFAGAFGALTLMCFPYVYLVVAAGLRGVDPAIEEAGRTLGLGRWQTFRRVTLPLLRPSIAAGALLVALYTLHDFGAVSLMRFETFTQAIYVQYRSAFDRTPAAILSLLLVVVAILVLAIEQRARGGRYHRSDPGTRARVRPVPLGRWRGPALVLAASVVAASVILPLGVLVFWLRRDPVELGAVVPFSSIVNAVGLAGAAAVLAIVAGAPIAVLAARHPGAASRMIEQAAHVGYALPGLVVGLAFVFLTVRVLPGAYQTTGLLVLAYLVLFLPQASQPLKNAILQISPRQEEVARTLGRSRLRASVGVLVPQVSGAALAGAALVFVTAIKELPATLLLRPTGFETLATRVWSWTEVGRLSQAAAPALLLLLLSGVPLFFLIRRIRPDEVRAE